MIPWDLDRTLGDHWRGRFDSYKLSALLGTRRFPAVTGWNRMMDKFLTHPKLRRLYLDRIEETLKTNFTAEKLDKRIDALARALETTADADVKRWGKVGPVNWRRQIKEVKKYIRNRRDFLNSELAKIRDAR